MKLTFLGHAVLLIEEIEEKYNIIIDPFITGNPAYPEDFILPKLDYILLTHGHGDHLGNTVELCKKFESTVISNYEICSYLQLKGCKVHPMHIGGVFYFEFGKVKLTPALHGSSIIDGDKIIYGGNPCGFLLKVEGKNIYHAGDTGLTKEFELLKDIDVAFLPIGGNFVMDIEDAMTAVEMIRPKTVVPIHYNTWEIIKADVEKFKESAERLGVECIIMEPRQTLKL